MRTTVEALIEVQAIIKRGWTQGLSAVTDDGRTTLVTSSEAVQWCLTGAVELVSNGDRQQFDELVALICKALPSGRFINDEPVEALQAWNDVPVRSKKEVITLLERVITIVRSQEVSRSGEK